MSDKEEKSSNDVDTTRKNLDGGTKNPEIISEGNVTLDSIKKTEEISAISQNMPRSVALEGSGDDKGREIESELKEMTKESIITNTGKGNGDNAAQIKAGDLNDKTIDYIDTDIDLNEAKSSKIDVVPEQDESNDLLDKCDESKLEKIHDLDDEEIELRWDDDDGSNIAAGDDNIICDAKNNDVLSEDQLLEEPSDVITKEMSEMHSDENSKGSEGNLVNDNSKESSVTGDKTSEDVETTNISEISQKLSKEKVIPTEKAKDENISNILEDKYLVETDMNAEMINSPEMIFSSEESLDHNDIKTLEDKLLDETEMSIDEPEIDVAKEITVEKENDEPLKETEPKNSNILKEVPTNDQSKKDIIEEDKLLAESESNNETETEFKMPSFIDVVLDKVNDNATSVKNLLKETYSVTSSGPAKDTETSGIISMNLDKEDSDDVLLEEKLLEEPEPAGDIPETDASMDVDDEKEGELLKDDEFEDDICTPMDVDITGSYIEDQVKIDDKIEASSMGDQSEEVMKDTDHKAELEKFDEDKTTDHISDKDQSDNQVKPTETVIDQPIEDTTETVDTSKDTTIEEQSLTAVLNKETAIKDAANTEEKTAPEIEEKGVHQPIDDNNRIEDSNKDQSTVESNTTAQSDNSSKQSDTDVVIEEIEKPTVEKEIEIKVETEKLELPTESVNPDNNLDKNKADEVSANMSYEPVNPDKILDKTNDTHEVSPNNSFLCVEDMPICIKTDHGLHKPDVMLEIPTQELIDMDDPDLSMDLDQSEIFDITNEVNEDLEHERTAEKMIALCKNEKYEKTNDKTITEVVLASDKTVDKNITEVDTVSVDSEAVVVEKTVDKIITETVNAKAIDQDVFASDKTVDNNIAEVDTVSVDSEAVVVEKTADKIITETVNAKAIDQDVFASDKTVDKNIAEVDTVSVDSEAVVVEKTADKIVTETVNVKAVDQDVFASDKTVDKNIAEVDTVSVDSEAVVIEKTADEIVTDTLNEKAVHQDVLASDNTVDKNIAEVDTVSVESEAVVIEKTVNKMVTNTVNEKPVDQEAIVTKPAVSEVQTGNIAESASDKKVEDTVAEATIEDNMEKMFADDGTDVKEVPECVAKPSQVEEPVKQPSTSTTQMTPDTSDEVPEISDSLGLLAESAGRMMEDDEEPEDDEDADEDDDFDQDESSNQISAEQSEDSNPAALEPPRDQEEKTLETPDPKDEELSYMKMDVDIEEYGTLELQAESMHQMNEETKSAVDALLRDNAAINQVENQQKTKEQMDIETVKLSDTSDNEIDVEPTEVGQTVAEPTKEVEEQQETAKKSPSESPSKSNVSPKQSPSKLSQSPCKQSPSKLKNLAIATQAACSFLNIVDLEESSSSEDDIQVVQKVPEPETTPKDKPPSPESDVTNVNIPTGIEIMCTSGGNTSEITTKEGEVVISGVPKPPPHKPARLNTSEVSIKTVSATEPINIPETKMNEPTQAPTQPKHKLSLEIFNLDSDEEDNAVKETTPNSPPHTMTALELDKARETSKCINYCCKSDNTVSYKVAEPSEVAFYDAGKKRRSMVCQPCAEVVANRSKNLMQGIKDMTPILELDMGNFSHDLVQISDSESEDEEMSPEEPKEPIGEKGAKFIEDNLAKYLNDTWKKYEMDVRLKETQIMLDDEIEKLEQDSKEIDAMLNECQVATDKLRNELYATFECRRQDLPALILYDTPEAKYIGLEEELNPSSTPTPPTPPTPPPAQAPTRSVAARRKKRRLSSTSETPAKRPAIPLGYAPLGTPEFKEKMDAPIIDYKIEDDTDISVVKLSSEAAPPELPPPGEISRPPLRVSMPVYAMKNAFGPWLKGRILEIQPKNTTGGNPFSLCRVKFEHKTKNNGKVLSARCIAYSEPADVRMTIGTRLIALFKDTNRRESYYSGVVAEIPTPVNNYRYLVFFDDGYAQYVQHQYTRLVCESSPLVWEEVHPFSREFVRKYLLAYPERPMVRLHEGQHLKTEWNGTWWSSRITRVDASLAQIMFVGDGRREWIYRGSTRLAPLYLELRAAQRHRVRPMPRSKAQPRLNMPYVEYTRSDEPGAEKHAEIYAQHQHQQQNEEIRRQRAVAKKSTSAPPQVYPPSQQAPSPLDPVTSRVVYYTPKNAVKPLKMVPHKCTPKCKRNDVLSLKELRTYNPLAKPLLSGWERQIIRYKGHKEVMYRAPCGRRLRNMRELHVYLRSIDSDLPVDLFDFHHSTHCLAEFVLNKCLVGKKDLSHGKENVPVPCVNYYDDSLPEFCSYNTERTPTAGVPLNLSPDFLCGCDCTDDCQDKSKCACWKMTLEGARTIGLKGPNVGYVYRRLPEPLPSGIYECNSRCKCRHTCLNRVAQQPLQLKLQVFKTPNRGWGIRALNDVPKGSFLCVYAGNLLTDATANLDGLNEGDEYLAELDYIEVVEQMKEGYEEDIPEADKKLIKKESAQEGDDSDEDDPSSSEEEDTASKTDKEDDDFRPGYIALSVTEFNKHLRKREKSKKEKEEQNADEKVKDTIKEESKDTIQEESKDTIQDESKDTIKEEPKDTIEEESKDNIKVDPEDTIKEELKDIIEEEIKDTKEQNAEEECITISDDEEVREPSRFMAQDNMKANEYISKYKSVRTLFGMDEACYIMDAKVQGNIGRYLNHSCCPNVFVQNVFVDTHDPRFPWVAFFALSHIKAGTELTWNYNYDVGSVPGKILYCYCGAPNCRGRLL